MPEASLEGGVAAFAGSYLLERSLDHLLNFLHVLHLDDAMGILRVFFCEGSCRHDDPLKSELDRFVDPFVDLGDILHDAGKRYFSDEDRLPEGLALSGGDDGGDRGEIGRGILDGHPSRYVQVDVVALKLRLGESRDDGDEQIELPASDPSRGSFRISEFRVGGECLDLDEHRTASFQRHGKCGSGESDVVGIDEFHARILDVAEPRLGHAEEPDLIGRSESVLERPQDAVALVAASFEEEDRVDEVLEDLRPGYRPVLGDVPDEHDGLLE